MQLGFFELLEGHSTEGSVHDFSRFMQKPVVRALTATNAFNRLRGIKFLGAIDYIVWPTGRPRRYRHNRFEHSLSVAFIGDTFGSKELSQTESDLLLAATLLHDIGHAPLSHSMEPAFVERFGIDHHVATVEIITGASPLGDSVTRALKDLNIDPDKVLEILESKYFIPFFSGPINFDTIDGISRAKSYFSPGSIQSDISLYLRSINDINFVNLDDFWATKDLVYKYLINGHAGLLADACAYRFAANVSSSRLNRDSYFLSEERFRHDFPDLFQLLSALRKKIKTLELPSSLSNLREYKVNRNSHDITERYITIKRPRIHDLKGIEFLDETRLSSAHWEQLEFDLDADGLKGTDLNYSGSKEE